MFSRGNHTSVATKDVFVATKIILVAVPASDTFMRSRLYLSPQKVTNETKEQQQQKKEMIRHQRLIFITAVFLQVTSQDSPFLCLLL